MPDDPEAARRQGRAGRKAALVIVGTGVFWILANIAGDRMGWSNRDRALLDLFALVGFGYGLWLTWQLTRRR